MNVPISGNTFSVEEIRGTIGEVVLGKKGRTDEQEITIFDSTGLAIQDLAIAGVALRMGRHRTELPFP